MGVQIPHCLGTEETAQGHIRQVAPGIEDDLSRLCQYKGVQVVEGMLCADHVHMCLSIPPKYSVSTIVGYLKGKSAIIVFENYSRLKRNFKGHSFWARGYYVNTVGWTKSRSDATSRIKRSTMLPRIRTTMT